MTKTVRDTATAAEESFHKHYAAVWGEERWASLYRALAYPTRYAALANRYAPRCDFQQALYEADVPPNNTESGNDSVPSDDLKQLDFPNLRDDGNEASYGALCYSRNSNRIESRSLGEPEHHTPPADFPHPRPSPSHPPHLTTHYNLDAASLLAAHLLDVHPGDSVLDLCAAPGGKSIAIAQNLWPNLHFDSPQPAPSKASRLVCNEADSPRQRRLAENLRAYLPAELFKHGSVAVTRADATSPSPALGTGYDKILVDSPCSSERHIVHASLKAKSARTTAPEMATWRATSSKRLAATQLSLLLTALKAVKVGGEVLYATCSISPVENDGVIEKMLASAEKERKKGQRWTVQVQLRDEEGRVGRELGQWAERTKYGWIVLPDHAGGGGWGPLFFCLIKKVDAG